MTARRRIGRLPEMVAALAAADRELFDRLFRVSVSEGRLRAPESMRGWLTERFGGAKAALAHGDAEQPLEQLPVGGGEGPDA